MVSNCNLFFFLLSFASKQIFYLLTMTSKWNIRKWFSFHGTQFLLRVLGWSLSMWREKLRSILIVKNGKTAFLASCETVVVSCQREEKWLDIRLLSVFMLRFCFWFKAVFKIDSMDSIWKALGVIGHGPWLLWLSPKFSNALGSTRNSSCIHSKVIFMGVIDHGITKQQ